MKHRSPAKRILLSGQSLHLHVHSGDTVVALRGAVDIDSAPAWLGEALVRTHHRLGEGEAHAVMQDGWLNVVARGDAEVACVARESRMRALLGRTLALLAAAMRRLHRVHCAHAKAGKDL